MSRENLHFGRHMERLSSVDGLVLERLKNMQYYFMSLGTEVASAKNASLKLMVTVVHRESLIEAFGDIFFVLFVGLFICMVLVYGLKKVSGSTDSSFH